MKAKTNMEGKYIKKCAEVSVAQTQKRCNMSEKQLKDEIEVNAYVHLQSYGIHKAKECVLPQAGMVWDPFTIHGLGIFSFLGEWY